MPKEKKVQVARRRRADSSTDRVLGLLDLFTVDQPIWTVDMLSERNAGVARATLYRYVKALTDSGFLAPAGNGGYSLGPRFIEIDRQIRIADPLLRAAPPVMTSIRSKVAGAQLLCRFYEKRVVCIHEDRDDPRIKSSFERGRPFPLFAGAPSKIILANLSSAQLQRLYLYQAAEISEVGLGTTWIEFRDYLKAIRKAGVAVASDIDKTLVGVAAPIFLPPDVVTASLCLVRLRKETSDKDIQVMSDLALSAAATITEQLQKISSSRGKQGAAADIQLANAVSASAQSSKQAERVRRLYP